MGSSQTRDEPGFPALAGGFLTTKTPRKSMMPNFWPWDLVYPPFLRVGVTCALYLTSRIWRRCWDVCDHMFCDYAHRMYQPSCWRLSCLVGFGKAGSWVRVEGLWLRASKKLKPWTEFCQHPVWAWQQTLPQSSLRWGCSAGWQPDWALWALKKDSQRSGALITDPWRLWDHEWNCFQAVKFAIVLSHSSR